MKKHVTAKQSILVFTQVFPNSAQPGLGLFVRERMLRVGNVRPIVVVAPVPWFPMQSLIRYWHPDFRAEPPRKEIDSGIEVFHPRFLSVPGGLKWLDGLSMALFSLPTLLAARKQYDFKLIDSHFAFPDGYAASILGDWLKIPVTITLRGTEIPLSDFVFRRACMVKAINSAVRIFTVANSLKDHMIKMGARNDHILRVGNGVDVERFHPEDKAEARRRLKIAEDAKVLIGAGGLCERKGFHRVIKVLPKLMERHKDLVYLIVGGGGPEGDWSERLQKQTINLGLQDRVRLLGRREPDELRWLLSAADVFVLATRNEGWANVFLEAMACGLPVVTTDVGGNREVVSDQELGMIVPFGIEGALREELDAALSRDWDKDAILQYAQANSWDDRVKNLDREFARIIGEPAVEDLKAVETDVS